jgi:hypothetical protein
MKKVNLNFLLLFITEDAKKIQKTQIPVTAKIIVHRSSPLAKFKNKR